MCVQHFGFIDFISVEAKPSHKRDDWMQVVAESRLQLQTNTIFQASKTLAEKKYPEYALGTYLGLTFIQVQ
jgi:hypothetical protein